jgi:hypothetical protein
MHTPIAKRIQLGIVEFVRVYLVGYIFCTIDYHICRDIFGRIDIMYCRLPYISRGVLPLKTPAPLYICTSIKQYNHLTFGGTPLSNYNGFQFSCY